MIACMPSCVPFADPTTNVDELVRLMQERCEVEKSRTLKPTTEECDVLHLQYFLRVNKYDIEQAMRVWTEWVTCRHEMKIDDISDEDIQDEVQSNIATWRGCDKDGRPCLVVTGRYFDPRERKGTAQSFQKVLQFTYYN